MSVILFRLNYANVPKPEFSTCFPADFLRISLGYAKDMLLVCDSFTMPTNLRIPYPSRKGDGVVWNQRRDCVMFAVLLVMNVTSSTNVVNV